MSNRSLSPFWTLFILTGLNALNYLDRAVGNAVLTPLQKHFQLGDGDLGLITTIFMLGYFITSPVFGFLGDRMSRKWLIAAGIFIWSVGTVATGFAQTFFWLLAFRVLVGVGEASYATISPSYISDTFPPARRNNALTVFYAAIPVGYALGYILGGMMEARYGWRSAFIWAGAPGLVLALLLLPFKEPARGQAEGCSVQKPTLRETLGLLRLGNYSLVVWGYTAYTFALGAFAVWGPVFLQRVHKVSNESSSTFFGGVLIVAGLVGTTVGGFLATRWQRRSPAGYAAMLGLSVVVAAPLATIAFLTANKTVAMACLAAAMFFIFLCTGPVNTLILESVPVNLRASAMAMSIFCIHLFGDLWSPWIVGALSNATGDLQKAVLILPAALVVAAVLWLTLAAKQRREGGVPFDQGSEIAR